MPGTGGIFEVRAAGRDRLVRHSEGRFPEIKELKRLVRDRIAPGRTSATPIANGPQPPAASFFGAISR